MHVQGRGEGICHPRVSSLDEGLSESQAFMFQEELIRGVQDLDNNQLWGVLEALQTKMGQREGLCSYWNYAGKI